jgi:hypothetical protein
MYCFGIITVVSRQYISLYFTFWDEIAVRSIIVLVTHGLIKNKENVS